MYDAWRAIKEYFILWKKDFQSFGSLKRYLIQMLFSKSLNIQIFDENAYLVRQREKNK